ncbi:YitT family protein [Lutibacter sp. B2]|nr:YitT family protein [Lutibacter sp. B2]
MKKLNIKKVVLVLLGIIIVSIGINCFIVPSNLLSGGVTGIALIIYYLTHFPVGISMLILNIPIFLLGIKHTNKTFIIKSLIGMVLLSFTISLTQPLTNYIKVNDLLANAILAGLFNGIGLGLVIKNGYSTGGFDIVNIVAKKKLGMNIAATNMMANGIIVSIGGMINDVKLAVYTIITITISSIVLDKVIVGLSQNNLVLIVSEKSSEISDEIINNIGRGVTFLKGEGAYTKKQRNIIYCIVSNRQLVTLKDIVNNIDKKAFLSITQTSEIHGQGFEKPVI